MSWLPRPSRTQLGAGALVVAALATGRVITGFAADTDVDSRPFERASTVGETLHLRWGDLEVTRVEGSRRLGQGGDNLSYGGPAVWMVATVRFTPRKDSTPPAQIYVRGGDGTTITKGGRNVWRCRPSNPGIPTTCGAAFEVRATSLVGSRLVVGRDLDQDNQYDDQAVVDLGISKAEARAWNRDQSVVFFPLDRDRT